MQNLDNLASLMDTADEAGTGVSPELPVSAIRRDPKQPRQTFDEASLQDLAASIAAQGVVQPIVVRPDPTAPEGYLLVSGERRWRAAQIAGLDTIPAVVRELDDDTVLAVQLVENLNREDVPVLEEAEAVERLVGMFGKAKDAAKALGKTAAWVSQRRKVHKLSDEIKALARGGATRDVDTLVMLGDLAKADTAACDALLAEPAAITRAGVRQALDVAKGRAEAPVAEPDAKVSHAKVDEPEQGRVATEEGAPKASAASKAAPDPELEALQSDLSALLGTAVSLSGGTSGDLRIRYSSLAQLDGLLDVLRRGAKRS